MATPFIDPAIAFAISKGKTNPITRQVTLTVTRTTKTSGDSSSSSLEQGQAISGAVSGIGIFTTKYKVHQDSHKYAEHQIRDLFNEEFGGMGVNSSTRFPIWALNTSTRDENTMAASLDPKDASIKNCLSTRFSLVGSSINTRDESIMTVPLNFKDTSIENRLGTRFSTSEFDTTFPDENATVASLMSKDIDQRSSFSTRFSTLVSGMDTRDEGTAAPFSNFNDTSIKSRVDTRFSTSGLDMITRGENTTAASFISKDVSIENCPSRDSSPLEHSTQQLDFNSFQRANDMSELYEHNARTGVMIARYEKTIVASLDFKDNNMRHRLCEPFWRIKDFINLATTTKELSKIARLVENNKNFHVIMRTNKSFDAVALKASIDLKCVQLGSAQLPQTLYNYPWRNNEIIKAKNVVGIANAQASKKSLAASNSEASFNNLASELQQLIWKGFVEIYEHIIEIERDPYTGTHLSARVCRKSRQPHPVLQINQVSRHWAIEVAGFKLVRFDTANYPLRGPFNGKIWWHPSMTIFFGKNSVGTKACTAPMLAFFKYQPKDVEIPNVAFLCEERKNYCCKELNEVNQELRNMRFPDGTAEFQTFAVGIHEMQLLHGFNPTARRQSSYRGVWNVPGCRGIKNITQVIVSRLWTIGGGEIDYSTSFRPAPHQGVTSGHTRTINWNGDVLQRILSPMRPPHRRFGESKWSQNNKPFIKQMCLVKDGHRAENNVYGSVLMPTDSLEMFFRQNGLTSVTSLEQMIGCQVEIAPLEKVSHGWDENEDGASYDSIYAWGEVVKEKRRYSCQEIGFFGPKQSVDTALATMNILKEIPIWYKII